MNFLNLSNFPTLLGSASPSSDPDAASSPSPEPKGKKGKKKKKAAVPGKMAKDISTLMIGSEAAEIGLRAYKFAAERLAKVATPAVPLPNFNLNRPNMDAKSNQTLTTLQNINGYVSNALDTFDLLFPARTSSQGQMGYLLGGMDRVLAPAQKVSLLTGLKAYSGHELGWQVSHSVIGAWDYMLAGRTYDQQRRQNFYPGQTDYQRTHSVSGDPDCATADMQFILSGCINDGPVGNLDQQSGEYERNRALVEAGIGQNRARLGLSIGLLAQNLENTSGRPTAWSALVAAPFAADLLLMGLDANKNGEKFPWLDAVERAGIAIGAFGIETWVTDPFVQISANNNMAYALSSFSTPGVIRHAFTPQSPLGGENYDPDGGLFGTSSAVTAGLVVGAAGWAGFHAGRAIKLGDGSEQFVPLVEGAVGFLAQSIVQIVQMRDHPESAENSKVWPIIAAGAGLFGVSTALGYLLTKKKPKPAAVAFDLNIGANGIGLGLSFKPGIKKMNPSTTTETA